MPTTSTSLMFTWCVESLILGLIALAVCEENYLIYAQLAIGGVTLALHLVALAAQWDGHHSISVSYLCVVTSMLFAACTRPLGTASSFITLAFFIIAEIAALGMTFTSCEGKTALFLTQRGHYALLIAVVLDFAQCWDHWVTGAALLVIINAQFVPFSTVALAFSIGSAGAFSVWSAFSGSWAQVTIGAIVMLTSTAWLVKIYGLLSFVSTPEVPISAPYVPWGTVLLSLIIAGAAACSVWGAIDANWVQVEIGVIVMLTAAAWMVGIWTMVQPSTAPSAPPLAVAERPTLMVWPRIRPPTPLFKDL